MNNEIKNKVILVLGGTGEVGSVVADLLEKRGATVCRHGQTGEYMADVRDSKQTDQLLNNLLRKFRKIDVVVNCLSAPLKVGGIEKKNWQDFQNHFGVQLKSAIEVTRVLVPLMKSARSGHFINILSSATAGAPPAIYPDYVAAKYAMLGFSMALAEELRRYGISVSCVSPDFIKTELTKNFPEKLSEIIAAKNESGRLTTPQDVARAVVDLILNKPSNFSNVVILGGKIIK